jgi:membrane protease YdiL (CAAX protease family)
MPTKAFRVERTPFELPVIREPFRSTGDDGFAASLRGFGPLGIVAVAAILLGGNIVAGNIVMPVGAALVLLWARLSRTPWSEIGFVRPPNWFATLATGIAFGAAFKLVMKVIVMPLLGADAINRSYHYLAGNPAAIPATLFAMIVSAGIGEEIIFRGFLFERLGKLLGTGTAAIASTIVLTSLLFGLGHVANQGLPGAEQATIVGLVYGTIYARTRRLPMLMAAHAAFDLTAYAIIYWNVESEVAHLIFR